METVKTTHLGNIRKVNEDAVLTKEKDGLCLLIIADGMGGHNAGEVASNMAITCLEEYVFDHTDEDLMDVLCSAVSYANSSILSRARKNKVHSGMGTTITAALIKEGKVFVANVGDSRTYHFSKDGLKQVTVDHSYVQQLVNRGVITQEEAQTHPRRNLITRAVGTQKRVRTDVFCVQLTKGDVLLMCSDGLTSHVSDDEIISVLTSGKTLKDQIKVLQKKALAAGGSDNITIILYQE